MNSILKVTNIKKRFPGVQALDNVSINFNKGEVRALVGENGAGKSTFISILTGVIKPDSGKIFVSDREVNISNVAKAKKYSIGAVYQESSLIDYMSVAENIFLGQLSKFKNKGIMSYSKINKAAEEALEMVEIELDVKANARFLNPTQKKLIEITKVLLDDPEILILDEPTAIFDYENVAKLFNIIRNKKKNNKTIIFISHRLREVLKIADKTTVLKEGKVVKTVEMDGIKENDLINLMTGSEISQIFPKKLSQSKQKTRAVLSLKKISSGLKLKDINIDIRKGEVVALAGLKGHGQSTLLNAIFGINHKLEGDIYINGKKVEINCPVDAINHKIGMLSNKKEDELCYTHSITRNFAMASLDKRKKIGFIDFRKEKDEIHSIKSKLKIADFSMGTEVVNLSGGNKQKVVFGKWLLTKPDILLCDEPAEGLDIGTKSEVYHIIRGLAEEGKAILLVLSDMVEVLNLPDRIFIMREGKIVKEFSDFNSIDKASLEGNILKASMGATLK